jgi:hypothetical protein
MLLLLLLLVLLMVVVLLLGVLRKAVGVEVARAVAARAADDARREIVRRRLVLCRRAVEAVGRIGALQRKRSKAAGGGAGLGMLRLHHRDRCRMLHPTSAARMAAPLLLLLREALLLLLLVTLRLLLSALLMLGRGLTAIRVVLCLLVPRRWRLVVTGPLLGRVPAAVSTVWSTCAVRIVHAAAATQVAVLRALQLLLLLPGHALRRHAVRLPLLVTVGRVSVMLMVLLLLLLRRRVAAVGAGIRRLHVVA